MKKLIFGITGATGSGKTTVSTHFKELGVNVIDADKVYHSLIKKGMPCLNELVGEFGKDILTEDGDLNRKALAEIAFSDKNKLKKLNNITHKYIKEKILTLTENSEISAIDAAVLIGSDIEDMCEYVVYVSANEDIRLQRIIARDNLTVDEAKKRISSQPDEKFYIDNSDFVIYNNGNEDTRLLAHQILSDMRGA